MRRNFTEKNKINPYFSVELNNSTDGIIDLCGHSILSQGSNLVNATFDGVECCKVTGGTQITYKINENLYPLTIVFNVSRISINGHSTLFFISYQNTAEKRLETCNISSQGQNKVIFFDLPGVYYYSSSYTSIDNNKWYNFINVVDNLRSKVYVDGVLKNDITLSASANNKYVSRVGFGADYSQSSNVANAYVRKFMLFDYAIQPDDITYFYNHTKVKL